MLSSSISGPAISGGALRTAESLSCATHQECLPALLQHGRLFIHSWSISQLVSSTKRLVTYYVHWFWGFPDPQLSSSKLSGRHQKCPAPATWVFFSSSGTLFTSPPLIHMLLLQMTIAWQGDDKTTMSQLTIVPATWLVNGREMWSKNESACFVLCCPNV